ncbi:MAG TPA: iron-sulfur cluster carrier protein ApbC, partial [Methylophaga sp.]|nr:iron-sulfur cluster carrier protein ApbC [Methylophaga sp.]
MTSPAQIEEIVKNYQDPSTLITLGDTRATVKVSQDDNQTQVDVTLGYPVKGYAAELAQNLKQLIEAEGAANVSVNITTKIVKHKVQQGV